MSKITAAFILLHFNFQPSYGFLASLSTSPHRHHCCNYNEQQIHEQLHPITTSTTIINTAAEIASTSTSTSLNVKSKLTHAIESIHPNQPPRPKRVPFLSSTNNPYIIFKLDQNASKEEIKKAYNKIMKKFHPDSRLTKHSTQEERLRAHDDFNRINTAYAILLSKPQYEPYGGAPTGPRASTTHTGRGYGGTSDDSGGDIIRRDTGMAQTNTDHLQHGYGVPVPRGIVPPTQRQGLGGTSDDRAIEKGRAPPSLSRVMELKRKSEEARLRAHEARMVEEMKSGKGYGGTSNEYNSDGKRRNTVVAQTNSDHLRGYRKKKNIVSGIVPPLLRKGLGGTSDDRAIEQGQAPPSLERVMEQKKKVEEARRKAHEARMVEEMKAGIGYGGTSNDVAALAQTNSDHLSGHRRKKNAVKGIVPPLQRKGLGGTSDDGAIEKGHAPPSLERLMEQKKRAQEARRIAREVGMVERMKVAAIIPPRERKGLGGTSDDGAIEKGKVPPSLAHVKQHQEKVQEAKRKAFEARMVEERKAAEVAKKIEEVKKIEEARLAKDQQMKEEARLARDQQMKEEARLARDQQMKEEARIVEEQKKESEKPKALIAYEQRLRKEAEDKKMKEETRAAEWIRMVEEARIVEERKLVEQQDTVSDWNRMVEEARVADERRSEEEIHLVENQQMKEEARIVEERIYRMELEARMVEEIRIKEEMRLAEEQRIEVELRIKDEKRLVEKERVADLKQLAQEASDAEEIRVKAEAQKAYILENHQNFIIEEKGQVEQDDIADLERLTQQARTAEEIIMKAEAQKSRIIEEHERFIAESLRLAEQARLAKQKRLAE